MKKILMAVVLTLLSFSGTAYADTVTQFIFKSEPQTIEVDSPSKTITIQSQNSSGVEEDITETTDLVFTTTSGTGQFLSTSGNPVSTTMSKNTSNKNFLYKDGTPGTYTISVTATGRTSLQTFSVSQEIFVVPVGTATTTDDHATTTEETTDNQNTPTQNQQIVYSAHSSPAPLNNTENKIEFEVSAGRNRLTSVGNSIIFEASPTKLQNISSQAISYEWSFGDGTTYKGKTTSHAYKFPGDYSVILNANASDKQAVSRIEVMVIKPDLVINKVPEGVEVSNKTSFEVNLEGWSLVEDKKSFIFPKDTIISPMGRIIFSDDITQIIGNDVQLLSPLGKLFSETHSVSISTSTSEKMQDLSVIQSKVLEVKDKLAKLYPEVEMNNGVAISEVKSLSQKESIQETPNENLDEVASVVQVIEDKNNSGTINKFLSWPVKGFSFIRHLFVEN